MEQEVPAKKHRLYVVLAIIIHFVLAGLIAGLGLSLSVSNLGIVAGIAFVLILLAISVSYIRNFGRETVGYVRTGSLGLGRVDVLLIGMATVGWMVLVVILGPGLSPGSFLWFFAAFWALFALFLVVLVIAARNIRQEASAKTR